jgi:hypothetical protein
MHRVPLTLRALLLVPLLAVAVDQARAGLVCGSRAETCLQAAGQGWLGGAGIALLVVYSLAAALFVGRLARGDRRPSPQPASLLRLWVVASGGVAAVCGGQAVLARALGAPGALGGGWTVLLVLCVLAGAVIALALHAAPAAAALLRSLRPGAPRPRVAPAVAYHAPAPPSWRPRALLSLAGAGRAPPHRLG